MKNIIITLLLLILTLSNVSANVLSSVSEAYSGHPEALSLTHLHESSIESTDYRVEALENVFKKYNSPLQGLGKAYVEYADKHGTDWKLLPAIAGLESSFGKRLMPNSHNGYGWGGGHIYFASWEEGIDKINATLKAKYYGRGATDVWSIGPIYAESPTWAVRVNSFIAQIEAEEKRIKNSHLAFTL